MREKNGKITKGKQKIIRPTFSKLKGNVDVEEKYISAGNKTQQVFQ